VDEAALYQEIRNRQWHENEPYPCAGGI
jgi:hypothetical protein